MPRTARVDGPGALHHVMIRGLERREIFRDDGDRWDLIARLSRLVPEWAGVCFSWVFMGNHVHLALRTRQLPLAQLMRRLNTGFAVRFNQRHERVGYLFQNRFKSRLVGENEDLRALIRYLQLNPLRGGLVENLSQLELYPWSGYGALLGHRSPFPFESVDRTLSLFGEDRDQARRKLRSWMAAGVADPGDASAEIRRPHETASRVLPLDDGIAESTDSSSPQPERRSIEELMDRVTRHFAVSIDDVTRGARHGSASRARAAIAFIAVVRWRIPAKQVAEHLGVSTQAVCQALARGARVAAEEGLSVTPRES